MQPDDQPSEYEPSNPAWRCLDTDVRGEWPALVMVLLVAAVIGLVLWLTR